METKKEYIAPELTVVTFKTERGYAASSLNILQFASALFGLQSGNMETWSIDEDTFDDNTFEWQ